MIITVSSRNRHIYFWARARLKFRRQELAGEILRNPALPWRIALWPHLDGPSFAWASFGPTVAQVGGATTRGEGHGT